MSFDVKVYSPSDVILTFGGAVVEGWESITVSRDSKAFKTVQGIRNKNAKVRNRNTAATIDINLSQISVTNTIFSQIVAIDEVTGGARIEVTLKDVMGGEIFSSNEAYFDGHADRSYEDEISTRRWRLNCLSSSFELSGGYSLGSLIDTISSIL